jgi:hypothetical protein
VAPRWKRLIKALGRAWVAGFLTIDPLAYSHYIVARAASSETSGSAVKRTGTARRESQLHAVAGLVTRAHAS